MLEKAGKVELDATVAEYELSEPIRVTGRDGVPYHRVALGSLRGQLHQRGPSRQAHAIPAAGIPGRAITRRKSRMARTFVFYEEVQPLMEKGLIKGGSLENAVVIRGDAILSREPLRYDDEFVRHKILDVIGDLSLFPARLKAHIYAVKPGHALNVELAREIYEQYKHRQARRAPFRGYRHQRGRHGHARRS